MKGVHYITGRTMKIVIFSILLTVQAQYIEDGSNTLIPNENSSVINDLNLVTLIVDQPIHENDSSIIKEVSSEMPSLFSSADNMDDRVSSQFNIDATHLSTIIPDLVSSRLESDEGESTFGSQTRPSYDWSFSSFLSTNDLDFTTPSEETRFTRDVKIEEQWLNVNQSNRGDPYRSILSWKPTSDPSSNGVTFVLTSEPRCLRQMCSVKLQYNGTLSTRVSGCLSFSLRTRGQPVGQLWIIEDKEQDNLSQRIQLINKTLRIEHSLRSKIKNLTIETQILFRNTKIDTVTLSNLKVDWKGSCPKYRPGRPTPFPDRIARRSTLEEDLMRLSSEVSGLMNTLTTNEEFESSQQHLILESTTVEFDDETNTQRPFSFVNQKNIGWFLSLIASFAFLIILLAIGHGLWAIRRYHHFSWHVTCDTQIQFLARRSLRSSTRSDNKIATISEIAYDILNSDAQQEHLDTPTTNTSRSTAMSYYTYL